jgi:hypothetical protein
MDWQSMLLGMIDNPVMARTRLEAYDQGTLTDIYLSPKYMNQLSQFHFFERNIHDQHDSQLISHQRVIPGRNIPFNRLLRFSSHMMTSLAANLRYS